MKITEVRIIIVPNDERLKAYASIIFDNCFIVNDLKIIQTDNKLFIAMPSKKHKNKNTYYDIVHPLNHKTRAMIQEEIFKKYEEKLDQLKDQN